MRLRRPTEAVVSADGRQVAFSVAEAFTHPNERARSRIWTAGLGDEPVEATSGPVDALPRWSPDGTQLAFASDRGHPGLMSLHLLEPDTGDARPLGALEGSVEQVQWSPDGRSILLLVADPGSDRAGAQQATKISGAGESDDPRVLRPSLAWRRLFQVSVETGEASEVSPDGVNVWEFDLRDPSSVVAVLSNQPSESAWYSAYLGIVDFETRTARAVYSPQWQLQSPSASPDGTSAAFVECFCSDRTIVAGPPKVVDLATGEVTVLASDVDAGWVRWRDRSSVWYAAWQGLGSACGWIELDGTVHELWSGEASLGARYQPRMDAAANGTLVAVRESAGEPPEIVTLAAGEHDWHTVSNLNGDLAAQLETPRWRRLAWTAADGLEIEGLLALPQRETDDSLPLVVLVHGGPTASWNYQFAAQYGHPNLLADAGYAVLLPNPRGSSGRGEEFARMNHGDMGGGDLEDILAGIDACVEAGVADADRVAIMGGSYGGFMSAWAITQTDRFAAAVPMAVVSNWLSFHLTTNIGRFDELFLDADPYQPGGPYFDRSPVAHARRCRTPTLIVHGELDLCTPVGQARELYQALVDAGAETELVVYPREGHGWQEWDHQIDVWRRIREWLDGHLAGDGP